jgi:hypothetical protein
LDDRVLIEKIVPSKPRGLFHVVPSASQAIGDTPIDWAAKAFGIIPRD